MIQLQVQGLDSLIGKLRYLGGNAGTAMNKGLSAGAQRVKRSAKELCPFDTGRLKGSIESRKIGDMAYCVYTNVEYAVYVEFGTGRRGDPKVDHTASVEGMSPRPYLLPALEQNKSAVDKEVRLQLIKAIRRKLVV